MSAILPADLQAKLDQAITDRDAASAADTADAVAVQALQLAQDGEAAAKTASIAAHKTALDSAHVLIDAMTAFLNN